MTLRHIVLAGLLLGAACSVLAEAVALPEGYRMAYYRAPTPASLPGATVLHDSRALQQLIAGSQPVLLDVMAAGRVSDAQGKNHWLPAKPRQNLPGSVWLANVGYGELAPDVDAYFRQQLQRLTAGEHSRALVFYCLRDCWMSWNAARRALQLGYQQVFWYPDGSDGWQEAGLPLQAAEPVPM